MSEKSIHTRLKEKRDKLIGIHASLALHMSKELTPMQKGKASEFQDRLDFRILQAEEQLLDDKIDLYEKTLNVLRG